LLSSNGVEMHGEGHAIAEADGSWLLARSPGTTPD